MGYLGGVLVLEVLLAAVGYVFLWPLLRARSALDRVSYLGVAVVAGNAACLAATEIAAVAGARTGPAVVVGIAVAVAATGFGVSFLLRPEAPGRPAARRSPRRLEQLASVVAGTVLGALAVGILYGGLRSTPWLDDSWFFWVPKGIALDKLGLDPRLFVPNHHYETLTSPDYPLGWSILLDTGMRFAGKVDLRVVNAEMSILTVAYLAAAARLLWSLVRPVFALGALALLALSPEFERQALGGGADLPVAFLVTLFVLAAAGWLIRGERLDLVLAGVFAAGALATKAEAAPELLAAVVVLLVAGWRLAPRRLGALGGACAAAVATAVPWFVWRQVHGVQNTISVTRGLDPSYLAGRTWRLDPTVSTLSHDLLAPRSWLVIVPLAILLTLVALVLERRWLGLAPLGLVAANLALLVWVYWADPLSLDYRLGTSAYRTIDVAVLLAALACAGLADRAAAAIGVVLDGRGHRPAPENV